MGRAMTLRRAALGSALLSLCVSCLCSWLAAPAFSEVSRLATVARVSALWAEGGARAVIAKGAAAPLVLVAGCLHAAVGARLDALTIARLPWLLSGACAAAAAAGLVGLARGPRWGLVAGVLLATCLPWQHAIVTGTDGAVLGSVALAVLATCAAARAPALGKWRPWAAALAAVLLALGVAVTLASLWVALLALLAAPGDRSRTTWRRWRSGRSALPAPVVLGLAGAVPALFALTPALWTRDGLVVLRWFAAGLGPSVAPQSYAGQSITAPPLPPLWACEWLVSTAPFALLAAAAAGLVSGWVPSLAPRSSRSTRRIATVLIALGVLWPAFAPAVLSVGPPRWEVALPGVVLLATEALALVSGPGPQVSSAALVFTTACAAGGIAWPATAGASFALTVGGAGGVAHGKRLPSVDGTELRPVLRELDARGGSPTVATDLVPREYWAVAKAMRRLSVSVVAAPTGAPLRRASDGARVRVMRAGTPLWALD